MAELRGAAGAGRRLAGVGLLYLATSLLGIWLIREAGDIAVFWPANGLLLGVLLRLAGHERLPALGMAALAALAAGFLAGDGVGLTATYTSINLLEVAACLHLIERLAGRPFRLDGLRQLLVLLATGLLVPAVAAFGAPLVGFPLAADLFRLWFTRWSGDVVGMVLFLPLALAVDPAPLRRLLRGPHDQALRHAALEGAGALAALVLLAGLALVARFGSPILFMPVLLWLALRRGVAATMAATVLVCITITLGVAKGVWPWLPATVLAPALVVARLQLLLVLTAIGPFTVAVVVAERERARQALLASEQRFALALEGAEDGIWDWHVGTEEGHFSLRWEAMLGYAPGELPQQAEAWAELVHLEDRERVMQAFADHLKGEGTAYQAEYRCRRKDGRWVWVLDRGKVVERDAAGHPLRIAGTSTDITHRKEVELELDLTRRRLDDALASMADGLALFDAGERLVLCNQRCRDMFPLTAELRVPGIAMLDLMREAAARGEYAGVDAGNAEAWLATRAEFYRGGTAQEHELGDGRWLEALSRLTSAGGRIVIYRDITERKRLERELAHNASHDPLTGLANRAAFHAGLERARARAARGGRPLAVMLVDLDRFKTVNDTLGHAVGDRLLVEVARRLRAAVREGDLVARLGGDEFAVVAEGEDAAVFAVLARRIVERLGEPLRLAEGVAEAGSGDEEAGGFGDEAGPGPELVSGASLGFAVFPEDPGGPDELLAHADQALYAAKAAGRGTFAAFGQSGPPLPGAGAGAGAGEAGTVAGLAAALRNRELDLDYQPILALDTLAVVGLEALLRWNHPRRGRLAAASFIPALEEAAGSGVGIGRALTRFVLARTLARQRALREAGAGDLKVWVNLAPRALAWEGLLDAVATALAAAAVAPDRLVLEIGEAAIAGREPTVESRLAALRLLGVGVAIGNFAAGQAPLGRLRTLPLAAVKIDRDLVAELAGTADRDRAMVRTVVALGGDLGLTTTAEGVETGEQLRLLRRFGCTLAQGYLFARPMPAAELEPWLAAWHQRRQIDAGADLLLRMGNG